MMMKYTSTLALAASASTLFVLASAPAMTLQTPNETWAFHTPVAAATPRIPGVHTWIDAFLLNKLRSKGIEFAPRADHRTLIRRLSFDLTGLPPTADLFRLTYGQAVERLLASPRYGERWGRHYLDVVRFGETDGGEHNHERPNAWPYRDYVIQAFNSDLPYDQFITEQIAGDVLFPGDKLKQAATGFLVSGPWDQVSAVLNKDSTMRKMARMDELDDMVTTTCATFLGLTVNCARCHDHKFDPIPTKDYYRLTAAFSGAGFGERSIASEAERKQYETEAGPIRRALSRVENAIDAIDSPISTKLLYKSYEAFDRVRDGERQRIPVNPIYNRNKFPTVKARYWRFAITSQQGGAPRLDRIELKPVGAVTEKWRAAKTSSPDSPVYLEWDLGVEKVVGEVIWSCNLATGDQDGGVKVYHLDASSDHKTWRTVCSSLDHISRLELDLPHVSDSEIEALLTPEQKTARRNLVAERDQLIHQRDAIKAPEKLYYVNTRSPEPAFLLERGNVNRQKEAVTPGGLSAFRELGDHLPCEPGASDADRRIALAKWLTDKRNPLTARVIVNRIWYLHFGNGIVNTPGDFGKNGDRPSQPELLDRLAVEFMQNGWSMKWLHRQILLTDAYQQSNADNPRARSIDAGNRLLWHMPLKRMDAETLRDSLLTVCGSMDFKMGGPSFNLHDKGGRGSYIYHTLDNDGPEVWRRGVYRFVVRGGDRTFLDSFDCPDPSVATPQRASSNTALQALTLMNNKFTIRQAGILAERISKESPDISTQIRRAYQAVLQRPPTQVELARGTRFISAQSLAAFCRALLNSNEFLYVP